MCVESRNKNGSPNTRMAGTKLSIGADEDLAIAMMPSCTSSKISRSEPSCSPG